MVKTAVILNPTAGQGRATRERVERAFSDLGLSFKVLPTSKSGDGTLLARNAVDDGCELVVAVGGDGTVNEVVNGIAGTGARLGIIPGGSVNVLAREFGIPFDTDRAAEVIASGTVKEIDLAKANDRWFTLMAGFGFDASVVASVLQPVKDIIGSSAYVIKGLEMLPRYDATEITLEMPDQTYSTKAFLVIVANVPTYSYDLKIAPYAFPDDGLLDVCVFERPFTDRIGFMQQISEVFMKRHIEHRSVSYFQTPSVIVRSSPKIMSQIDGDPFSHTPVSVDVVHRALPLIVPSENFLEKR